MPSGEFTVDNFNCTDLNNSMSLVMGAAFAVHTRGFGIEHHDALVFCIVASIHQDIYVRLCQFFA
ncbi:Uncharacterised protein [Vibrio cholerae]|nr:Uncharacterised protein [Vibrio cholerae]CSB38514.1 Uncharacterised protein [Vibrio cholerae]